MSHPTNVKSAPARTYSGREPIAGAKLTCRRCERVHPFPHPGGPPVRCECGWWYTNVGGAIQEAFKPRLGV
jgi:hypothetical protein